MSVCMSIYLSVYNVQACQQESQRIWPIASGTARKTQEDMVLSGYQIPKVLLFFKFYA